MRGRAASGVSVGSSRRRVSSCAASLARSPRLRAAIAKLPPRERKVIRLYYFGEATMKQIGAEIGVNESRVSQLHARAIQRLRDALGTMVPAAEAAKVMRSAILSFQQTMSRVKKAKAAGDTHGVPGVVLPYKK